MSNDSTTLEKHIEDRLLTVDWVPDAQLQRMGAAWDRCIAAELHAIQHVLGVVSHICSGLIFNIPLLLLAVEHSAQVVASVMSIERLGIESVRSEIPLK